MKSEQLDPHRREWERKTLIAGGALAFAIAFKTTILSEGMLPGQDFSQIWVGGALANAGRTADLFSPAAYLRASAEHLAAHYPNPGWSYPPTALLVAAPFALLPYGWALAFWSLLQVGVFGFVCTRLVGERFGHRGALIVAIAAPGLMLSLLFGQFSAIAAALLVLSTALCGRAPVAAGAVAGLLVIKPQLGLLAPLFFLARGAWTSLLVAGLTAVTLSLCSALAFGFDVWRGFLEVTLPYQMTVPLQNYATVAHSLRDLLLLAGLGLPLATALHYAVAAGACAVAFLVFRRAADWRLWALALALASTLLSPYSNVYELAVPALGALAALGASRLATPLHRVSLFLWVAPALSTLLRPQGLALIVPLVEIYALLLLLLATAQLKRRNVFGT